MKFFIAYKFSGMPQSELDEQIGGICKSLTKAGHSYFCSYWSESMFAGNSFSKKQILEYALKELDSSDAILVFINSENKSEGLLLEAGYSIARKKRLVLAIRKGIKTHFLREIAKTTVEFESLSELFAKLSKLK